MSDLFNRRFLALWTVLFLGGVATAPVHSLLPVYLKEELGYGFTFTALVVAIPTPLGGLFALLGGALCDSLGRKRTLMLGLTGSLVHGLLFIVDSQIQLLILRVYIGFTAGLQVSAAQSYLIGSVPRRSIGLASAAFYLGMTLGTASGNLWAGRTADHFGFFFTGLTTTFLTGVIFIAALLFIPRLSIGERTEGASVKVTLSGYLRLIRRREVRLLVGLQLLRTYYWGMASLLMPLLIFAVSKTNSSVSDYDALKLAIAALFQIMTGRICDKIGRRIPVLTTVSLVTFSSVMTGVFFSSLLGLYVFGVMGAAAAWSLSTTMPGLIDEFSREEEKGRAVGINHLAWSTGMVTGQLTGGGIAKLSTVAPFYVAAMLCGVAMICAIALLTGKRSKQPKPANFRSFAERASSHEDDKSE